MNSADSAHTTQLDIRALEVQTRLLYPFFYRPRSAQIAADELVAMKFEGQEVWAPGTAHEFYKQELLPPVSQFLFGSDPGSSQYLRLSPELAKLWFPRELVVELPNRDPVPVRLVSERLIELFLSPYGSGVLCVTLSPKVNRMPVETLDHHTVADFNYRIAQIRKRKAPRFRVLCSKEDSAHEHGANPGLEVESQRSAPSDEAALVARLGVTGGSYLLYEIKEQLLAPLARLQLESIQMQFNAYTTVRFAECADFSKPDVRRQVVSLLSRLTQVEEATHAGTTDDIAVLDGVLNRRHWCAVSSLGSAHFVSDQPGVPFNEQRVATVRDKYFIAYLLTLFQQITLRRIASIAGEHVRANMLPAKPGLKPSDPSIDSSGSSPDEDARKGATVSYCAPIFRTCVAEMHEFSVNGYFAESSVREVLNRYYRQCQDALRIDAAYSALKEKITGIDAACRTEQQANISETVNNNLDAVATIQNKVEWVEIIIVSYYVLELTAVLGKEFKFPHDVSRWGGLAVVVVSTAIIAYVLHPWKAKHARHETPKTQSQRTKRTIRAFLLILLLIVGYWVAGMVAASWFAEPVNHPSPENPVPSQHQPSDEALDESHNQPTKPQSITNPENNSKNEKPPPS